MTSPALNFLLRMNSNLNRNCSSAFERGRTWFTSFEIPVVGVMGVGDISELVVDSWGSGHTTGGDDDWEEGREVDTDMVGRHDRAEQDS